MKRAVIEPATSWHRSSHHDELVDEGVAEPSDIELIRQTRDGDERAIQQLLERYRDFARYKARNYFIPGAEHEDVVQEAMVGLFKAIRDFDPDLGNLFLAFADLCIQRQIHSSVKKANRQKHQVLNKAARLDAGSSHQEEGDPPFLARSLASPAADPSAMAEAADALEHVRDYLMSALTHLEGEILRLLLEGRTYEEMASILGLRVKVVDNALQRVRKKLKVFLESETPST